MTQIFQRFFSGVRAATFLASLACFWHPGGSLAASPNILLIIADDYGIDSCSLYNTNPAASLPPTTNLAALARSGILFRNAYANPVCSPTRACLLTGRHGFRSGIGDVVMGAGSAVLTASEFTLPEAFAANPSLGFKLAHFGKWHLANAPGSPNTIGGWPHYAGNVAGALASYTNWTKTVNGVSTTSYTNYATTDIVNDAISWIQAQGSQPWFAWVAFNAPHTPFHKPPTNLCPHYVNLSGTQQNVNSNPRPYFEAMVEAMDLELGRLLSAVDRTNTHIIFLGDNGTPGQVIQPPYSSTRAKDTLYEGGIHVPFIMAGPAVVQPGRTNNTPVHAVDLFSTILDLAGISNAVPTNILLDSKSLLPLLQTDATQLRYAYSEKFGATSSAADARALRNIDYKLIHWADGREEFYCLATDPYELTNLLTGPLTAAAQANYYNLQMKLGDYQDTLASPQILSVSQTPNGFTVTAQHDPSLTYQLWRSTNLAELAWAPLTNALVTTNASTISWTDPAPPAPHGFYRLRASSP